MCFSNGLRRRSVSISLLLLQRFGRSKHAVAVAAPIVFRRFESGSWARIISIASHFTSSKSMTTKPSKCATTTSPTNSGSSLPTAGRPANAQGKWQRREDTQTLPFSSYRCGGTPRPSIMTHIMARMHASNKFYTVRGRIRAYPAGAV